MAIGLLSTHNSREMFHALYEQERQHEMGLASDSSDEYVAGVGYDKEGNMMYFVEKWDEIGEGMSKLHINDKELLGSIMNTQVIGVVVGRGYKILPTLIDNTSAESWIQRLYARLDDDGSACREQRLG